MCDEQLNLLENLATLSIFNEIEAHQLWDKLLATTNNKCKALEPNQMRKLFSTSKKFADCDPPPKTGPF